MGRVIFLALSKRSIGFWLRYTLQYDSSGLWLSMFSRDGVKGFHVKYPQGLFRLRGFNAELGESKFSLTNASGKSRIFSWSLNIKTLEGAYNPLPPLIRLMSRDRYLITTPLAVFNGYVSIGND